MTRRNPERRQLTVMFCDIADSTNLSTRLDPEELRDLIAGQHQAWDLIIRRYEGFIARYMGDGVLVYFGYPTAHEDDAERAAHAALGIVELVSKGTAKPSHVDVAVRIGIATGLAVVGGSIGEGSSEEQPAFGLTPNLAARLQGLASPNSVVIAEETRRRLGPKFACEDLGRHQLKGILEPVSAWRLVRPRVFPSRFAARYSAGRTSTVDRQQELELLYQRWSLVCGHAGQVVRTTGEPGVGKSHLCEAFLDVIAGSPHTVIRCQCSALHTHIAFFPLADEVQRSAGIAGEDSARERVAKLEALLRPCGEHVDRLMPAFAGLLALPTRDRHPESHLAARALRKLIIDGLVARLVMLSERAPVILLLEDAHWSDPSTQEFLAAAIASIVNARVLILVTARPGSEPEWAGAAHVTPLLLGSLERRHAGELISLVADQVSLACDTVALIVERSGGVPLFLVELTKSAAEISKLPDSASKPASGNAMVPTTLHDSLMSQLDRLGASKPVAQLGAVIGRTFPYRLLSRLWTEDAAALARGVADLIGAGIVTHREHTSDIYYMFRHELIRDAAYESILRTQRRCLHIRIAKIIGDERASSPEMRPELIAHHYTAAGMSAEAAPVWLEAGQLALRESANREACASLKKGLECAREMPGSPERTRLELRLQYSLGQALIATSGHASPEVRDAFSRAYELCMGTEHSSELFAVVWGITAHHLVKGDIRLHLVHSARLLQIAQASGDSGQLVVAHTSRTLSRYFSGQFTQARRHLDEVRSRYDRERHRHLAFSYAVDRKVIALQFGTWILWKLGYPDQAAELEGELNEHARGLDHPNSLAQALTAGASVYMLRREPDRLLSRVNEGIRLAELHGYPVWVDHADFWLGWALAEKGNVEEGITRMNHALAAYQKNGAGSSMPKFLGLLADRLGEIGRLDEGLALLNQAIEHIERTGETASEAEVYRLRGKLRFVRNRADFSGAKLDLAKAIDIAQGQRAKAWELRSASTLAEVLMHQDQRRAARDCLAPVYEWFSEGLDTPDLRAAAALLRDLD